MHGYGILATTAMEVSMKRPVIWRTPAIAAIAVAVLSVGGVAISVDIASTRLVADAVPSDLTRWPFFNWAPGVFAPGAVVLALFVWAVLLTAVMVSRPRMGIAGWLGVVATATAGTVLGIDWTTVDRARTVVTAPRGLE